MRVRRHRDLGVANLLRDEVPRQPDDESVRVVRTPYQAVHGDVDLDEVDEVGEVVVGHQLVPLRGEPGGRVAPGKFQDGVDRGSALQVDVQFHLGQGTDEGVR